MEFECKPIGFSPLWWPSTLQPALPAAPLTLFLISQAHQLIRKEIKNLKKILVDLNLQVQSHVHKNYGNIFTFAKQMGVGGYLSGEEPHMSNNASCHWLRIFVVV